MWEKIAEAAASIRPPTAFPLVPLPFAPFSGVQLGRNALHGGNFALRRGKARK